MPSVWGFTSKPTVGGWETRMVIETGLHRWDADQAIGEIEPLHDAVAGLGLDEYGDLYLTRLASAANHRVGGDRSRPLLADRRR